MENMIQNIGMMRQALLARSKNELENTEKRLVQYNKALQAVMDKLNSFNELDYDNDEYKELDKQRKDLAVKIGLTEETIAEYKTFVE